MDQERSTGTSRDDEPDELDGRDGLDGLSVLADPARRRLYDLVAGQDDPVSRDEAARACGISRNLAAYHLDRLVEAELLEAGYARPAGVGGPGAGRPAKRYRRVQRERLVSVPPRRYELLAELLATALDTDEDGAVRAALLRAAEAEGHAAVDAHEDLQRVLAQRGYEPVIAADGAIELRNCPFHRLSRTHTELVCTLNHVLLGGVLAGRGEDPARAELCPQENRCCVRIRAAEGVPEVPGEAAAGG
ncbi:helix-turn-helix domain-containing protein [Brachybacterium hainanense]|uniref:Helix-turn-helix domain-containing protein n=1 Tax=Brachybacterium hainanense TaxID=1541174 RepID=A0ABV6R9V1_9MICO